MPTPSRARLLLFGLAVPVVYGLVLYALGARSPLTVLYSVVTVSFMGGVPFAIGFMTVIAFEDPGWLARIFAPWGVFAVILLVCFLVQWEGTVCVAMAMPWLMLFSALGGITAGALKESRRRTRLAGLLAIAPLFAIPIETRIPLRDVMHTNVASVVIAARPQQVWDLVVSVDTIRVAERRRALYTTVGFPAPVAATLDRPGVGGVRRASFERGVLFTETITDWTDRKRLRFTIKPNTAEIPPTSLDPHVTVGGDYFDVLTGTYELEAIGDSATRLVLTSAYRVSTHFNRYSGWWADRIMSSVQSEILRVLKDRAERGAPR